MRRRNASLTVLVLCGAVLAACSGSSNESDSANSTTPSTVAPADCTGWSKGPATTRTTTSADARRLADSCLRLNQVQVIGSHNSYHLQNEPAIFDAIKGFDATLAQSIEYSHGPLPEQFSEAGVRQIELDVFADPDGGRYAKPKLRELLQNLDTSLPGMTEPGFKVLHAQDVDYNSNCITFIACLEAVKGWSSEHEDHLPIAILVEAKDEPTVDPGLGFVVPPPLTAADFDALDAEIRSVFSPDEMITPDDVRGKHETLEEAVLSGTGWPTLADARGKVLFLLDQGDQRELYLAGHPSLAGRVIFTSAEPGDDDAAFVKMNDPNDANQAEIGELVRAGYIVRTRSDGDTVEARANDTKQRDNAIESGAQYVSTDYPAPDKAPFPGGYVVTLPGNRAWRCNPINTGPSCSSAALDTLG